MLVQQLPAVGKAPQCVGAFAKLGDAVEKITRLCELAVSAAVFAASANVCITRDEIWVVVTSERQFECVPTDSVNAGQTEFVKCVDASKVAILWRDWCNGII